MEICNASTDAGGFMVGYRYHINRWLSAEGNYGYDRNTQQYFGSFFGFGGLGARLFGAAPHIVPHNLMDLSILLLVISIASNSQTLIHREDSKALPSGKV
jgi:hypothetical protein